MQWLCFVTSDYGLASILNQINGHFIFYHVVGSTAVAPSHIHQ